MTALENLAPQVQAYLSQPLHIDKATMVGLINDLERKALVQRQPHPTDRRAVLVILTEAGRSLLHHGYEMSDQFVKQFFKGITPEEQEMMLTILKRLASLSGKAIGSYE